MKHVRISLDANGREAEIHPVYDVLVNAPYVGRSRALQWNFAGDELGIMHYVEGDRERFDAAIEAIPHVLASEIAPAGDEAFYTYIRDAMTEPLRGVFELATGSPVVVIPPVEYAADGTVSYSVVGPSGAIQTAIERIPDPIAVTVTEIGGMETAPGITESRLSDRQREAIETAVDLGYYEIPRDAGHEAVANAIDCAPSTAAEHLRKAEATLLKSVLGE
ncbi:helix-turn-helix domain-containing protein [Natrinema ejinorense]|uniref:DNA-binding protein n=1 Tax=Natrinema ejinorense TaxID=373386 RepID=A0A2A5R057_9EURY|nr:helix-turn-helix domain-containing protein [Natrinema ejinorense]PCR92434.1 DNA-binding protein [Natrinema ejinorense]